LAYVLHILSHAERDLKKILKNVPVQAQLIATEIRKLSDDPRPPGHRSVVGQKDLLRIRVGQYRIIYSAQDRLEAVIIVAVRLKGEGTYRKIPETMLSDKIQELEEASQA
jgi:mRNA interferase RelE/StbE